MSKQSILLATHHLLNFTGSELVIFDLACELMRHGHDVTVATFIFDQPAKGLFEAHEIRVVDLLVQEGPSLAVEYDLLWVQHTPVINYLLLSAGVKGKKTIFSSLSPYDPLEAPPLYASQLSYCLANSPENRDQQLALGTRADRLGVFPNSAAPAFVGAFDPAKSPELGKIAIISNHIPPEITAAAELFSAAGLEVDTFGFHGRVAFVDASLVARYDALITIGRSIQYGLAAGIPVYCYDHFGGPGWIVPENLESAGYHNFSGRCCRRKLNPEEIVREVINEHAAVFARRRHLQALALERYSLESNVTRTLELLASCPETDVQPADFELVRRSNDAYLRELKNGLLKDAMLRERDALLCEKDALLVDRDTRIHQLNLAMRELSESLGAANAALAAARTENGALSDRVGSLEARVAAQTMEVDHLHMELRKVHADLNQLLTSLSWKVTWPLRLVRNFLRRRRD